MPGLWYPLKTGYLGNDRPEVGSQPRCAPCSSLDAVWQHPTWFCCKPARQGPLEAEGSQDMLPGTGSVWLLLALLLGMIVLGLGIAMLPAGRSTASLQRLAGSHTPGRLLQRTVSPAPFMQQHEERHIVVAAYREDLSWLQQLHIPQTIYTSHNASAGHPMWIEQAEAGVYLQFILERYEDLPDATLFIQAHQAAEHMPDKAPLLKRVRWRQWPYANLRYQGITSDKWGNWTGDWLNLESPEEAPPAHEVVWDKLRVEQSRLYAEVWHTLMESEFGPLPRLVHAPCCAEMLVSKQRILAHPKAFYQAVFDWLSTRTEEIWESNRYATTLEYMWHIMFGEDPIYYAPTECELLHC